MSSGTFAVTGLAITITAPTGTGSYAQGDSLPVSWTATPAQGSGEFSIWVVSATSWYLGQDRPRHRRHRL